MTAARDDRRALVLVCVLLLVGSGAAWFAGTLTWFTVQVPTATHGQAVASATGSQIQPTVTAVAAVLLAAVAATVALSGIVRRVLGVLVALVGVAAGWAAIARVVAPPSAAELVSARAGLNTGGQPVGTSPVSASAGPWVAVVAGLLGVAAGVLLTVREARLPRLGSRYAAPGTTAPPADPDRAAWQQLDEGADPTADPTDRARDDPARDPSPGRSGRDL